MHKKLNQIGYLFVIFTLGLTACATEVTVTESITEEPTVKVEDTKTPTSTVIPPTEEIVELIETTPVVDKERERISQLYFAAMDYMEDTPATFEDDFDEPDSNWGVITTFETGMAGLTQIYRLVHDGQLQFTADLNEVGQGSHQGALDFNAKNFIFRYSISPQEGLNFFVIDLRGSKLDEMEDQIMVSIRPTRIELSQKRYRNVSFDPSHMYDLLIVVENDILAVFVDGNLIIYDTSARAAGNYNLPIGGIDGLENGEDLIYFDYIGFWNLDGVGFELLEDATEEAP